MKVEEDRKAERAIQATKVLVALALAIATFGAYFFVRWMMGRW